MAENTLQSNEPQNTVWTPPASDPADKIDAGTPAWTPPAEDDLLGRVRNGSVDELSNDKTFRPDIALATIGAKNLTPEDIDKLTEVYTRHSLAGFDWARVPSAISNIPGAVADFVKGGVGLVKRGATLLNPNPAADPVEKAKAAAELSAAVEAGTTQTAGLLKSGARKVSDYFDRNAARSAYAAMGLTDDQIQRKAMSPDEFRNRLFEAAANHEQSQKITQGEGEISKATGLDADSLAKHGITLDEQAISQMSNVADLTNLLPIGAGFGAVDKATGKVLFTAPTKFAAESLSKKLGEKIAASGRAIESAGKSLGTLRSGQTGAVVGALADSVGVGTGAVIGAALPTATRAAGKAIEGVGNAITKIPAPVLRLGEAGVKGAVHGAASTLPLAASAEYEEDAANIVGAGAALGAASGAAHKAVHIAHDAAKDVAQATAARAFQETAAAPIADSPAYGTAPDLDAAHQQSMEMLKGVDPATANLVNRIRTVLPALVKESDPSAKAPEVYLLENSLFNKAFEGTPAENQNGVYDKANNRIVYRLDGSNVEAIRHEPAHMIFDLLPDEQKQSVYSEIKKAYGEKGIEQFTKNYEGWFNKDLPPQQHRVFGEDYILNEIATEHLSAILRGDKLDGTAPSVTRQLGEQATRLFEVLGLYKPEIGGTPNGSTVTELGVGVSPRVTQALAPFFREKMQSPEVAAALAPENPFALPKQAEAAPAVAPVAPAPVTAPAPAPVAENGTSARAQEIKELFHRSDEAQKPEQAPLVNPTNWVPPSTDPVIEAKAASVPHEPAVKPAENIRVTPEQQATLDIDERPDLNIAEAAEHVTPEKQPVFKQLREALRVPQGQVTPVEITYNSVTPENDPTSRTPRRADQAADKSRTAVQKLVVPTGFVVTKDGSVQVTAMSPDKVLSNAEKIVADAQEKGVAKLIPYETKDGALTTAAKLQFNKDLEAYLGNQAAGYKGNGKPLVRPENFDGFIPPQNPNFKPTLLSEHTSNFLNLVMGIAPPKTNRVKKIEGVAIKPTNVRARELATANLKPAQTPGVIGDPTKQNFKDFGNVEIAEFNPLRKALDEAGVNTRARIEVTERLNLNQIEAVTPRPASKFRAPVTDLISAGFMPATAERASSVHSPEDIRKMSAEEFAETASKWKGGLTGQAIELGKRLSMSELPTLESFREEASQKMRERRVAKDFDGAMAEAARGQFFREASEALRAKNGETGLSIRPENLEGARFMPAIDMPENPEFKKWFKDSKAVDENGRPVVVYHGSNRLDRVGNRFMKKRAYSGPMQFFTDDPQIASNYATNKPDNVEHNSMEDWIKIKPPGSRSEVNIAQYWNHLPYEERQRLTQVLPRIGADGYHESGGHEGNFAVNDESVMGADGWKHELKEARGNALKAAVSVWLESGAIFGDEEKFTKVLEAAGIKDFRFDDPGATAPGVVPVVLSIQNPLDTTNIPASTIEALEKAAQRTRVTAQGHGVDAWDKNNVDPKEWIAELKSDIASGKNSYAWTRIPDWVTRTLKKQGYDGIHDTGGKSGGDGHSVWIPFEPSQIKAAYGNRGTFDSSKSDIRFMPKFFSQLENVVASDKVPNSATPEQIRGILANPKHGIKADEIKWSGIEEFLAGKEKVSKKELQDFLAANRLEINEVVKGEGTDIPDWEEWEQTSEPNHDDPDAAEELDVWSSPDGNMEIFGADGSYAYRAKGKEDSGFYTPFAAYRALLADVGGIEQPITGGKVNRGDTKFEKWKLPGGKNYREVLYTLPDRKQKLSGYSWDESTWGKDKQRMLSLMATDKDGTVLRGVVGAHNEQRNAAYIFEIAPDKWDVEAGDNVPEGVDIGEKSFASLDEAKRYAESVLGTKNEAPAGKGFQSSHWDEKNVLAHARTAEHKTTDGKPVLLAEEIQSDWHQTGRKEGYNIEPDAAVKSRQAEAQAKADALLAGRRIYELTHEEQVEWNRLQGEASPSVSPAKGVPDAPFKNTWHEFVFKTLLHQAVESGKDFLAWTPGEMQAERYDLSKQVDKVVYYTETNSLRAFKDGQEVIHQTATPEELPDIIGKEAADKIINSPTEKTAGMTELPPDAKFTRKNGKYWVTIPSISDQYLAVGDTKAEATTEALATLKSNNRTAASHILSGQDLKVGGTGMKGFYDDIIVKFANKFGKKWGAKVETIKLSGGKDRYRVVAEARQRGVSVHPSDADTSVEVWALPITEAMRKSVSEEGLPQFMPSPAPAPKRDTFAPEIRPAKGTDLSGVTIRAKQRQQDDEYQRN